MQFSNARPDAVPAINRRWLLKFWMRRLGAHRVPRWRAIETADLSRISDNLSFLDAIGGDGALRFQIRFHGASLARFLDRPTAAANFSMNPCRATIEPHALG
jgi:hypothetical protein